MTTIAYDGKTIAADSQTTGGYVDLNSGRKIIKIDGGWVAGAGEVGALVKFALSFQGEAHEIDFVNSEALHVTKSGKVYYYDRHLTPVPVKAPVAIGSGQGFAVAAMLAGATAEQAVKIAIKLDPDTGGKIQKVKVK